MIAGRAPLRISFGGGGTDLPAYYERFGGQVLSAAITPACHVHLSRWRGSGVLLVSSDFDCSEKVAWGRTVDIGGPLSLPRAVLSWFATRALLPSGIRLDLSADVPPGSGLGSSSAMTVALVTTLAHHVALPISAERAAEIACEIEIDMLQQPIGRQDQYAAALGGINTLVFTPDGVEVEPLSLSPEIEQRLEDHLMLMSTRRTRDSASVLTAQRAATGVDEEVTRRLHALKGIATAMREALVRGDIPAFGALLDEGWQLKRGLASGVSSADIDHWYALAREAGAYGGKISGAGGGGFFLFCIAPERRGRLVSALRRAGLTPFPFAFDRQGATTVETSSSNVTRKGTPV
ncbi:MAG: hypothetical protein U0031_00280 [Thermomicrobiales bacterium]